MADSSSATPRPAGTPPERASAVRFGVFEVDFEAAELRKRGLRVRLQEQPFRVLSLLLEQPGRVVTREELQSKLWPGDTFVDFDHGLNTAVNKIRQALGDSANNPRFIETVHRRGYRFIAPVEQIGAGAAVAANPIAEPEQTEPSRPVAAAEPERPWARIEDSPDLAEAGAVSPPSEGPGQAPALSQASTDSLAPGSNPVEAPQAVETSRSDAPLSPDRPWRPDMPPGGVSAGSSPLRRWLQLGGIVVFAVTVTLGIVLVMTVFGIVRDRLARVGDNPPQRVAAAVVNRVRILAGQSNDYISPSEQLWLGDQFYVGGETSTRSGVAAGADDANLFLGERYGSFQYAIPVVPGKYRLTLHFAETWFGPGNRGGGGAGDRVFDVECNGVQLLSGLDVYREAGGSNRALVRTFDNIEPNEQGRVVVTFLPRANNGMVNALELTPMTESSDSDTPPAVPEVPVAPGAR